MQPRPVERLQQLLRSPAAAGVLRLQMFLDATRYHQARSERFGRLRIATTSSADTPLPKSLSIRTPMARLSAGDGEHS
jgi:hypothetical protein